MKRSSALRMIGLFCLLFALFWLGIRFLLPVTLPFLLGLGVAILAEPGVRLLEQKARLPRQIATGVTVTALLALLAVAVSCLGVAAYRELNTLTLELPKLLGSLTQPLLRLKGWLLSLADAAPDHLRDPILSAIDNAFSGGSSLVDRLTSGAFGLASSLITSLPDWLLFAGTGLLASFMISSQMPRLRPMLAQWVPQRWQEKLLPTLQKLRSAVGCWFKAQAKLMMLTFCIVTAGLCLLHTDVPLLAGALIALVDALPMLGTGTILIPWGILCFLQGRAGTGLGLILLYGTAALARAAMEPRILGRQLGLNPLLTLVAIYAGYRLWGVLGLLVAPMLVVTTQEIALLLQPQAAD